VNQKITEEHLRRRAIVYVRQSTPIQLIQNRESQIRQYGLVEHARNLGFSDVETIDADLGRSGSGLEERPGFQRLVAEVCAGQVGAILCIEASRLARNGRDWHQLFELCGLVGTLVIEPDGVYDPRLINDRLLLGLKGIMNEFELTLMRQRSLAAIWQKARRGEYQCRIPVGFCWTEDGRMELDPDRRVQQAVRHVFDKFAELGSAHQVFLSFREEGIQVPYARFERSGDRVEWKPPVYRSLHAVLENPVYAGAYVFGRTESRTIIVDGQARRTANHAKPREQWSIVIPDHHPGYITWEQYERNQKLMAENSYLRCPEGRRAGRGGQSLLTGLLRCGRCGRTMYVVYGGRNRRIARYRCLGAQDHEHTQTCLAFAGARPDEAVANAILRAIEPNAIEAAISAVERSTRQPLERREAVRLELEQAQYQARLAARRYEAVDPDNRLVCAELEARWNAALQRAEELERGLKDIESTPRPTSIPNREVLLSLAHDLPVVWNTSTDMGLKQRIARILIEEIVANIDTGTNEVVLVVHWAGGRHTELRVQRPKSGEHGRRTDIEALELIKQMAGQFPDELVAGTLNRLGLKTGAGNPWKKNRVCSLRSKFNLPTYDPAAPATTVTAAQAAQRLGIDARMVHELLRQKVIQGRQIVPYAPWQIPVEALDSPGVRERVRQIKTGDPARRPISVDTQTMILPGIE
jgi:DNA invertase Pin-like site-specific DNA recombinase